MMTGENGKLKEETQQQKGWWHRECVNLPKRQRT